MGVIIWRSPDVSSLVQRELRVGVFHRGGSAGAVRVVAVELVVLIVMQWTNFGVGSVKL